MTKISFENKWQKKFQETAQKNKDREDYQISLWKKEALEAYLKYFFLYFKKNGSGKSLLDIGCGPGTFSKPLSEKGFLVYGVDSSSKVIAIAKKRSDKKINYQTGDIYNLPFPNNHFDTVICLGLFQTLDSPSKALREVKSKLKPQGTLIITTLNSFSIFSLLNIVLKNSFQPKRFNPLSFKKSLIDNGFKNVKLKGMYFFPKSFSFLTNIIIKLRIYKLLNLIFAISNPLSHSFYVSATN